jgi:hypothetical protein
MPDVPSVDVSKLFAPFVLAYYLTNTENLRSSAAKYDKIPILYLFSKASYVINLTRPTISTYGIRAVRPRTKIARTIEDHIPLQTKV